jgi:hypothetical protein
LASIEGPEPEANLPLALSLPSFFNTPRSLLALSCHSCGKIIAAKTRQPHPRVNITITESQNPIGPAGLWKEASDAAH